MRNEIEAGKRIILTLPGTSPMEGSYVYRPGNEENSITPLGYHLQKEVIDAAWQLLRGKNTFGIIENFSDRHPQAPTYSVASFGVIADKEELITKILNFENTMCLGINREQGTGARWLCFLFPSHKKQGHNFT